MRRSRSVRLLLLVGAVGMLSACVHVERSSVSGSGAEGNGPSGDPVLSDDGRFVAFWSSADNLVPGDDNGASDVFVRDHQNRTTMLVSAAAGGGVASGTSSGPSISDDGRLVAFASDAPDIVAGDINARSDVFVRDLVAGTTTRVSRDGDGTVPLASGGAALSGDGSHIVFMESGELPGTSIVLSSVVTVDLATSERRVVAATNIEPPIFGYPIGPLSISDDGAVITYGSRGEHSLGISSSGVLAWERSTGAATFITGAASPNAAQNARVSGDGSVVTLSSVLDHVPEDDVCVEPPFGFELPPQCDPDVFVWRRADRGWESLTPGPHRPGVEHQAISSSDDASQVLLVRYVDAVGSLLVVERSSGRTAVVGRDTGLGGDLSGDGRLVSFATTRALESEDTNDVSDIYVRRTEPAIATSAAPSELTPGTTTAVTLEGRGFEAGTSLAAGTGGLSFSSVDVLDDTTLTVEVTVEADAPPGPVELRVQTPGRFPGSSVGAALSRCTDCLIVSD